MFKTLLINLMIVLVSLNSWAGPAVFSGTDIKLLKPNLDFFGSAKILSGSADPNVSPPETAPIGSLFMNTANGNLFRKIDAGSTSGWLRVGAEDNYNGNKLVNPGWEATTAGWTASAGSYSRTTTTTLTDASIGAASWDPTASSQLLYSDNVVFNGPSKVNLVGSCRVKGSTADTYSLQIYNVSTTTALASVAVNPTTDYSRTVVKAFGVSTGQNIRLQLIAGKDEASINIDNCFFGLADESPNYQSEDSTNYLTRYIGNRGNGDFEEGSTVGFYEFTPSVGLDTTTGLPVGSVSATTSASSGFTLSTVSSGQIRGNYSLSTSAASTWGSPYGFISNQFSIDSGDQARVFQIKMDYKVVAGAANMRFTGRWDGTLAGSNSFQIVVYDVTNSTWIQPAGAFNVLQSSGAGTAVATFQTASNSTLYQVGIVCDGAISSGPNTVYWDNITVGRQTYSQGPPISDWQSYTPTFTGLGTVASSDMYWRRVGSEVEVSGRFTVGTPTATEARVSLPSGLTTASTPTALTTKGDYFRNSTAVTHGGAVFHEPSVTYFTFGEPGAFGATSINVLAKQNGNAIIGAGQDIHVNIKLPISGWSSNTIMSSDTDTRVVDLSAYKNGGAVTAVTTIPSWTAANRDSHGAFVLSTGVFTVPVPGDYVVTASFGATGNAGHRVGVYKNGTLWQYGTTADATYFKSYVTTLVTGLVSGDLITIRDDSNVTASSTNTDTVVSIHRLSGPSAIAASAVVASRATGNPANATATNPIIFPTASYDTHGAYSASTGRYTAPISGYYRVHGFLSAASAAVTVFIYVNGVQSIQVMQTDSNGQGSFTGSVSANAGDVIDIRPVSAALDVASGAIHFERLGGVM